jgi:hypothetical protein
MRLSIPKQITLINQGVDDPHIPGGEMFEQQLRTEVDQVVNNAINNEINKGVAAEQDIEGISLRNQ